ncbi:NADH-quinone oxidoreductase subunit C [Rhodocyclus purpureus]|uniref:hydrogenase large subunit n=1 Tax=Rhodocyclus purpureus TaxID=1067 RepID=UPI0019126430|nr:NADH-quinone oxidoreductase subunit C [Rhodocyclus purpureus]MBK5915753.1 hypothetical protein [Rhodocyclus purpureus]
MSTRRFLDQPIDFSTLPGQAFPVWTARVDAGELLAFCRAARDAGRWLVTLWTSLAREGDNKAGELRGELHLALDLAEGLVCLTLPAGQGGFQDLAPIFPSAGRLQRAAFDLTGIGPESGDRRPWLRHANWPADWFPLRDDSHDAPRLPTRHEDYAFVRVEGEGVHEIPVGPIHAGTIEPGHFRFSVVGELVMRLEERLGWKHRGIARRFAKLSLAGDGASGGSGVNAAARLAGRIAGDSTVAWTWAFCQAAEAVAGVEPPPRALLLRALLLERERVAAHLADLGAIGNDTAFAFGLMEFLRLREDWLRGNGRVFGHRLLFDCVVPGGVALDLSASDAKALRDECATLAKEVAQLHAIYDDHAGMQDRLLTTGRVTKELALQLGLIGMPGRASDVARDLRCRGDHEPWAKLSPQLVTHPNGDVAARTLQRFAEIDESLRLIGTILDRLQGTPAGGCRAAWPATGSAADGTGARHGFGWVEGWRGDVFVALEVDKDGRIRRCHTHDPSWHNWPVLEHAVIGNIVADFPLINKSFNLSYAGADS